MEKVNFFWSAFLCVNYLFLSPPPVKAMDKTDAFSVSIEEDIMPLEDVKHFEIHA